MARILTVLILLITVCTLSCKKADESNPAFVGNWKGTYTGSTDNGNWNIMIAADRSVTGSATAANGGAAMQAKGSIDQYGSLNITFGTGLVFTGRLMSNTTAEGDFVNTARTPNTTGTWKGDKQ